MLKLWKSGLLLAGVFAFTLAACSTAQAAFLWADGTINHLEDDDYEVAIREINGEYAPIIGGRLQVGDLVAGVLKIQQLKDASPATKPPVDLQNSPDTFTGIFLLSVDSVVGAAGDFQRINFAPASQAEWTSVWGPGGPIDISAAFVPVVSPGTMTFAFDGVQFFSATEFGASLGASATTFVDGARLLWEFGFAGEAGEFWRTTGVDATNTAGVLTNDLTNRAALNVTAYHAGLPLVPHNHLRNTGDLNFTDPTHLQFKGSFENPTGVSPWPLYTDADIYLQPIPEPSSMTIAGVLACLFGAGAYRRRRQNGLAA